MISIKNNTINQVKMIIKIFNIKGKKVPLKSHNIQIKK